MRGIISIRLFKSVFSIQAFILISFSLFATADDKASASLFLYRYNESRLEFLLGVMDYRDKGSALPEHAKFMTDFGGSVDEGETHFAAAVREFGEECHTDNPVRIESIDLKAVINATFIKNGKKNLHTLYVAPYDKEWGNPHATAELIDVCWVDGEKLLDITTPLALTGLLTPEMIKHSLHGIEHNRAPLFVLRQDFFALIQQKDVKKFLGNLSTAAEKTISLFNVPVDYTFPHLPWGWCSGKDSLIRYPLKEKAFTKPTSLAHLQTVLGTRETDLKVLTNLYLKGRESGDTWEAYSSYLVEIMGSEKPGLLSMYHAAPAKYGFMYLFYQALMPYVYGFEKTHYVPLRLSPEFVLFQNVYDVMYAPGDYESRSRCIISTGFGLLSNYSNATGSAAADYFWNARSSAKFDYKFLMRQTLQQFGLLVPADFEAKIDTLWKSYFRPETDEIKKETVSGGAAAAVVAETAASKTKVKGALWRGQYAPTDVQRLVAFSMHGNESIHVRPDGTTPIDFESLCDSAEGKALLTRSEAFEGRILGDIPSDPDSVSDIYFWPPLAPEKMAAFKGSLAWLCAEIIALNHPRLKILAKVKAHRHYALSIETVDDLMHALLILPAERVVDHLIASSHWERLMKTIVKGHTPASLIQKETREVSVTEADITDIGKTDMPLIDAIFTGFARLRFEGGNPIDDTVFIQTLLEKMPALRQKKTAILHLLTSWEFDDWLKKNNVFKDLFSPDHSGYLVEGKVYSSLTDLVSSEVMRTPDLENLTEEQTFRELNADIFWHVLSISPYALSFRHGILDSLSTSTYKFIDSSYPKIWGKFNDLVKSIKQGQSELNRIFDQVDVEIPLITDYSIPEAQRIINAKTRFERLQEITRTTDLGIFKNAVNGYILKTLKDLERGFIVSNAIDFTCQRKYYNRFIKDFIIERLKNSLPVTDYKDMIDFDIFKADEYCYTTDSFNYRLAEIIDQICELFPSTKITSFNASGSERYYVNIDAKADPEKTITMLIDVYNVFIKHGLSVEEASEEIGRLISCGHDIIKHFIKTPVWSEQLKRLPYAPLNSLLKEIVSAGSEDERKISILSILRCESIPFENRASVFEKYLRYSFSLEKIPELSAALGEPLLDKYLIALIQNPEISYSNRKKIFNLIEKKLTTPEQWNTVVEGFFHDITKEYYSYETRKEAFNLIKDHLSATQWCDVVTLFMTVITGKYYSYETRKEAFDLIKDHLSDSQWADVVTVFMRDIKNSETSPYYRKEAFDLIKDKLTTYKQWAAVVEGFVHDLRRPDDFFDYRKKVINLIKEELTTPEQFASFVGSYIHKIQNEETYYIREDNFNLIKDYFSPEQWAGVIEIFMPYTKDSSTRQEAFNLIKDHLSVDQLAEVINVFMHDIKKPETQTYDREHLFELIKDKLTTDAQWADVLEGFLHDINNPEIDSYSRRAAFYLIKDHLSAAQRAEVEPLCR